MEKEWGRDVYSKGEGKKEHSQVQELSYTFTNILYTCKNIHILEFKTCQVTVVTPNIHIFPPNLVHPTRPVDTQKRFNIISECVICSSCMYTQKRAKRNVPFAVRFIQNGRLVTEMGVIVCSTC